MPNIETPTPTYRNIGHRPFYMYRPFSSIIRQKIWAKCPKVDSLAYKYAQNKMAGIQVCRIINRRRLWQPLCITFIMICVCQFGESASITRYTLLHTYWFALVQYKNAENQYPAYYAPQKRPPGVRMHNSKSLKMLCNDFFTKLIKSSF